MNSFQPLAAKRIFAPSRKRHYRKALWTSRKMFSIEYAKDVAEDLAKLRARDRKKILDRIDEQLIHHPTEETRNKKPLPGLVPPWDHEEPVWELRIGEHRVFYDVNEEANCVTVRAIRHKPPHKTTEEIL